MDSRCRGRESAKRHNMLGKHCLPFSRVPSQSQVLLRDPLLSSACYKTHSYSPAFESTYSVEHVTHFTLRCPCPLVWMKSRPSVQSLRFFLCFSAVACAQPPCGNFGLENSVHGGHEAEQMAAALLCPTGCEFLVCFQAIDNRLNHNMGLKLQRAPSTRAKVVSFPLEWEKKEFYFPILHSTSNTVTRRARKGRVTGNRK